ncbi:DUF3987 domain-containing protein, partial [Desulfovibrio sp. OttesenSCG-928-M16]|nr:DUF3987 domain-containing protein [Desulfovibrio sp. OttesenSCG-928-M16]
SIWWQNWRSGENGTWTAGKQDSWTAAEREAFARRKEENRKARETEQARVHAEAASKAQAIYSAAVDCSAHAYLTAKGVKPVSGLRVSTNPKYANLQVPVLNEQGKLVGLQFIGPDGGKKFLTGTCKKGAFFSIGGKDTESPLLIAEGLATALSLHECTGLTVVVSFDAGNLPPVAEMARRRYPNRKLVICADYDAPSKEYPNPGGIGLAKASAAALAVNGLLAVPTGKDGCKIDWNDLHQAQGRDEVWRQFCAADSPEADTFDGTACAAEPEQESRILPPPPPVPLEAFPAAVAAMLEEASEAFTVPLQIPAACLLGVLSCLVGGTRLISLRPSWKEPGNIWIATVAASGIGKTPCAAAFFNPIKSLEYEAFKSWQDAYTSYENELDFYRKERQKAKRGDTIPDKPIQPKRRQAYIDDATVEALGEVLSENPRGIMWRKDELAGLIADLDKYSSSGSGGGTRSRLLSSYDGQEWKTSRASNPTRNLYIPHAYVGIFGGIQPAMLPKVFEAGSAGVDEASGFLQRFMLIRAEREKPGYWTERYLSHESKNLLASIVAALWAWDIEYDAEGREVEKIVPVSRQAKAAFVEWFNGIAQEEFLSQNAALLSKLKGQAQRLCLLLHCLDSALTGTDGMQPVTEHTMRRALLLANWVKEHQEQCWRFFTPEKGAKQADPIERAIMQAVVNHAARIEADGWKISNTDLCSLVENILGMPGLSNVKIGKAASALGLTSSLIGERRLRGRLVTKDAISMFKATLSPTPKDTGATHLHSRPVSSPVWTEEAGPQAYAPEFDFNDPAYPDEDRVEI